MVNRIVAVEPQSGSVVGAIGHSQGSVPQPAGQLAHLPPHLVDADVPDGQQVAIGTGHKRWHVIVHREPGPVEIRRDVHETTSVAEIGALEIRPCDLPDPFPAGRSPAIAVFG